MGQVFCWGNNLEGRLATGSVADYLATPKPVPQLEDVKMIDGGENHFCAVVGLEHSVTCWGSDGGGALGDGSIEHTSSALVDTGVKPVTEVRAGWRSTCALLYSGDVACWGRNDEGEFGNGTTNSRDSIADRTLLASKANSLSFRWGTGCALLSSGRVQCWGHNQGNVGNGLDRGAVITPEDVLW